MTTVYLAGPVGHAPDGAGGSTWRTAVANAFDAFDFLDPLAKYNVPVENLRVVPGESDPTDHTTVGVDDIVHSDKAMIDDADGVLVGYSAVRSIGTPMEVMYAFDREMPVALWTRNDTPVRELSPWYRHHASRITTDVRTALDYIDAQATEVAADD